jgi:L-lactate utilization protein LutB
MIDSKERSRVRRAVEDRSSLDGMRKSFRTIQKRQKDNASRMPDLDQRQERLRSVKEASVGNEPLFVQAVSRLRENGFRVLIAKTAAAAVKQIEHELDGYHLVVKSKSNVTKEIHLTEHLESKKICVIETDLGDRIIQLAGCEAAHPTGPACHLTRKEISSLFAKHFDREVSDDPMELTEIMREEIASYLGKARVGITGANAITAEEGAVVIVHNEGNAAKCAMLPDKHIVITTPEKIVPTLDDAINVTKLQTYLSTGKIISSYLNIITGPSYTSDIEKQPYRGMHGPKEVIVVFVDDGRLGAEDKEAQYCIGCGMCLLHCPTYDILGPVFGTSGHMGGQGVYLAGSTGKLDEAIAAGLYLCTSCGACKEVCPSKIDIRRGVISSRSFAVKAKKQELEEHHQLLASISNYENPWQVPRKQKGKWAHALSLQAKGEVLYFAGCSTSLLLPELAKSAIRLIRACGVEPAYLGQAERCCGSTIRKLGHEDMAKGMAEACFADFKDAGAKLVITSCPGCASALNHFQDLSMKKGIKVQHLSQFLHEHLDTSLLSPIEGLGTVSYHDPCDLGRELGIYDEPRELISSVSRLVEMDRSRASSDCCGSGSGVRSAFPELSSAIAGERIAAAKVAGADVLVTSCPWCVQSLRDCQSGGNEMQVLDLVELLDRSLSARVGRGQPARHRVGSKTRSLTVE